jgi:hypothetical protein
MSLTKGAFMRAIKLIITHTLQPHHPPVDEIDTDDLNEAIQEAIDSYLDDLAEELSGVVSIDEDGDQESESGDTE